MRFISAIAIRRSSTSSHRLSAAMVISAISRAMAAPSLMAIPASASDRAGESLIPSPIIKTVCPSRRSREIYSALSAGSTSAQKMVNTGLCGDGGGGFPAVAGKHDSTLYPQRAQFVQDVFRLFPQRVGDTDHGG